MKFGLCINDIGILDHNVVAARHIIGVIARPALQRIRAAAARKRIVAIAPDQQVIGRVTGEFVIQAVASAVVVGGACQFQVFNAICIGQIKGDRGFDSVGAQVVIIGLNIITHRIIAAVDDIGIITLTAVKLGLAAHTRQLVIAFTAIKRIISGTARKLVIARVAGDDVVTRVACAGKVVATLEGQVFNVITQGVIDRGFNRVDALFVVNLVRGAIDNIGVITSAAVQAVNPFATIQPVIVSAAIKGVVVGAPIKRILIFPAIQLVNATVAKQLVAAVVTGDCVVKVVARAVKVIVTRQRQVFNIVFAFQRVVG